MMLDFDNLDTTLWQLAFGIGLNVLYKRGSYRYPRAIFDIQSTAELQLVILTFSLVFTGILWYATLAKHWTLLASLFSDLYQILIPQGSPWYVKWVWAAYFGLLVTLSPFLKTRAALRRIWKKTPVASLKAEAKRPRSSLWAYIKERRRLRKVHKEQQARLAAASSTTFPEDVKVDLEKSHRPDDESIQAAAVVVEDAEKLISSIAEIREENSTIRRAHARYGMNVQWIYLVVIGCYLNNQLVWNAHMSDGWGLYCDILSLSLMYAFPVGWAMSFLTVYEAAVDHQEARALIQAAEDAEDAQKTNLEEKPLIIVTED